MDKEEEQEASDRPAVPVQLMDHNPLPPPPRQISHFRDGDEGFTSTSSSVACSDNSQQPAQQQQADPVMSHSLEHDVWAADASTIITPPVVVPPMIPAIPRPRSMVAFAQAQQEQATGGLLSSNSSNDEEDDDDDDDDDDYNTSNNNNNNNNNIQQHHHLLKQRPEPLAPLLPSIPRPRGPGNRTTSTAVRLKCQGFRSLASNNSEDNSFAVRSIRRGSDDWRHLIQPFVSDLVFRSVICRPYGGSASSSTYISGFRPYTCHAAVLFVDLCSYSRITAAIAHKGAHYISNEVNAYLKRLLHIIHDHGGDVVKFAGDAVLIVWEGTLEELALNVLCAAKCVLELFDKAGSHTVSVENNTPTANSSSNNNCNTNSDNINDSNSSLAFRIHCGLTCGSLHSEIFEAPTSTHMQRLYHIVGGETVEEMGYLVDLAGPGQVCCSKEVLEYLPIESCIWIDPHHERTVSTTANSSSTALLPPSGPTATSTNREVSYTSILSDAFFVYADSHNDDGTGQEDGQDNDDVFWSNGAKILTRLDLEPLLCEKLEQHVARIMMDRLTRRNKDIEEDFIHPSVLHLLCHGGLSPTQIAQMRNLCVLFIAMTSNGSSLNWLMEVQQVLDKKRCPIVQLIFDDKGVHIVAAVNLYESAPETGVLGLEVCRELVDKQVGCAIGMALGSTFCGVTGSVSVACRWDITGPPAVRAARLMQYALAHNNHQLEHNSSNGEPLNLIEVAIDESVYQDPMAATRMQLWHRGIFLKGTSQPCPIYTLSTAKDYSAFRVLETVHGRVHDDKVRAIQEIISFGGTNSGTTAPRDRVATTRNSISSLRQSLCGSSVSSSSKDTALHHRCAVLVTGPSMVGKKIVCQRAAGYADLVPFLHVSDVSSGLLQLARTIATWYNHVVYQADDELKRCAQLVLKHLNAQRWSRAHDECIRLVDIAMQRGLQACFLVDRVQFLDEFSLSLIRECLRPQNWGRGRRFSHCPRTMTSGELTESAEALETATAASGMSNTSTRGRICFLCVHVSLYHWRRAHELAEHIGRSNVRGHLIRVPVVVVGPTDDPSELRTMFRDVTDMEVTDRWLTTYAEASGSCAGYFINRAVAIRRLLWQQGEKGYTMTTEQLVLQIPTGKLRENKRLSILQVSADAAMKFFQIYDELPPLFQTFGKVLTIATQNGIYQLPKSIMWEVLNDLIAEGCEAQVMSTVIDEMIEMCLIKNDTEHLSFLNPAMVDIILDVCTPIQVHSMTTALIQRLEPIADSDFRVPLLMATLYHNLNDQISLEQFLLSKGYRMFLNESKDWSEDERNRWKEAIDDEVKAAGQNTCSVLGSDFHYPPISEKEKEIGPQLSLIKMYSPPISFGPMSHSLAVLCVNIFHEFKHFHGASPVVMAQRAQFNKSASKRYLQEMAVVETFLNEHGLGSPDEHVTKEKVLIQRVAAPATDENGVQEKARWVLSELIPIFVEDRLRRLYQLIVKLREGDGIPAVIQAANLPLRLAYEALHNGNAMNGRNRNDAAQDSLMTLATMNYKPKKVPEDLPLFHYQTVARIRNKVLRRLSDAELAVYRHQQSIDDLEVFLVVTSLLYQAAQEGRC